MSLPERIGPYRIARCLGRGGMGVVFEASHPDLPRSVALKLILPGPAKPATLERFWREAQALARVNHPGVVRIHDLVRDPAGPYLVEELVSGETLSSVCEDGLPPERAAKLLRGLADALSAVHAAGILHRDLKPSNVIVRPGDAPVLLDFGLARAVDAERLTLTNELLGTPGYMAPEQAEGGSAGIDERTDVYQLGAVGYHMLAGEPPYEGPIYQVLTSILKHDPIPWPDADPALLAILKRATDPDPAKRFRSAAALRDALDGYLAGVAPPPPPAPARPAWLFPLILFAALLGIGVGAAAIARRAVAPPQPRETSTRRTPPTRSPEPTATATTLWDLRPGETLRFETWIGETDHLTDIKLSIGHAATIAAADAGRLRWDVRVEAIDLVVDIDADEQLDLAYHSRRHDERSPFVVLRRALGKRWSLLLDPRTGAVEAVRGVESIRTAVSKLTEEAAILVEDQKKMYELVCRRTLTDAYIRSLLDGLLRLRAAGTSWVPTRDGYRLPRRKAPRALRSPRFPELDKPAYRFTQVGRARVAAGRVRRCERSQSLVGTFPNKDRRVRSRVYWGFALVP